jgi:hypothetical protein
MPEPIFMKLGVYIMASEPISAAYFINSFRQSVYLPIVAGKDSIMYIPPFVARQRLAEHVPAATNTNNNRRFVGRVSVGLCIPLSLLVKNFVKTFPRQRTIVEGVVFHAGCVISNKIILVLSRN